MSIYKCFLWLSFLLMYGTSFIPDRATENWWSRDRESLLFLKLINYRAMYTYSSSCDQRLQPTELTMYWVSGEAKESQCRAFSRSVESWNSPESNSKSLVSLCNSMHCNSHHNLALSLLPIKYILSTNVIHCISHTRITNCQVPIRVLLVTLNGILSSTICIAKLLCQLHKEYY